MSTILDELIAVQKRREPPGITGTVIPGGQPGYTRVVMTLTPEKVSEMQAKGFIVRRMPKPGQA